MGAFTGPSTPFGVPTSTIHPSDNDITPDPLASEAERINDLADQLYNDIRNHERNSRPKPTQ